MGKEKSKWIGSRREVDWREGEGGAGDGVGMKEWWECLFQFHAWPLAMNWGLYDFVGVRLQPVFNFEQSSSWMMRVSWGSFCESVKSEKNPLSIKAKIHLTSSKPVSTTIVPYRIMSDRSNSSQPRLVGLMWSTQATGVIPAGIRFKRLYHTMSLREDFRFLIMESVSWLASLKVWNWSGAKIVWYVKTK